MVTVAFAGYQLLTPNLRNIDFYLCTNMAKTDSKQQLRLLAKFNFSISTIERSGPQARKLAKQAPGSFMQTFKQLSKRQLLPDAKFDLK